jgi:5'-nucleotidase / UDP-sugar diphosphatase
MQEQLSSTANSFLLQFIGIIKHLRHELVRVPLKNEKGEPLKSVNIAIIHSNKDVLGVKEVNEWIALVWFLQHPPDLNGNGMPDIPEYYSTRSPRLYKK